MSLSLLAMIFWAAFSWSAFLLVVQFPLTIVGWILVPTMAYFKAYHTETSKIFNRQIVVWNSKLMDSIFGNQEEGIISGQIYSKKESDFKQLIYWYNRNPVDNLRFIVPLAVVIQPSEVRFIGSLGSKVAEGKFTSVSGYHEWATSVLKYDSKIPQWFFCWQGLYSSFYYQFKYKSKLRRLWIGWKILPKDIFGVPQASHRRFSAGFAVQFKEVR